MLGPISEKHDITGVHSRFFGGRVPRHLPVCRIDHATVDYRPMPWEVSLRRVGLPTGPANEALAAHEYCPFRRHLRPHPSRTPGVRAFRAGTLRALAHTFRASRRSSAQAAPTALV